MVLSRNIKKELEEMNKALEQSINKYRVTKTILNRAKEIVTVCCYADEITFIDENDEEACIIFGIGNCPCCTEYYEHQCKNCPIYLKNNGQNKQCQNTPYSKIFETESNLTLEKLLTLINEEIEFLESCRIV